MTARIEYASELYSALADRHISHILIRDIQLLETHKKEVNELFQQIKTVDFLGECDLRGITLPNKVILSYGKWEVDENSFANTEYLIISGAKEKMENATYPKLKLIEFHSTTYDTTRSFFGAIPRTCEIRVHMHDPPSDVSECVWERVKLSICTRCHEYAAQEKLRCDMRAYEDVKKDAKSYLNVS